MEDSELGSFSDSKGTAKGEPHHADMRNSFFMMKVGMDSLHNERNQLRWFENLTRIPSGSFRGIKMGGDPIAQWRDYFHRLAWEHLVAPPEELALGGDRRCEHLCLDGSSCDLGQISRWRNNE